MALFGQQQTKVLMNLLCLIERGCKFAFFEMALLTAARVPLREAASRPIFPLFAVPRFDKWKK